MASDPVLAFASTATLAVDFASTATLAVDFDAKAKVSVDADSALAFASDSALATLTATCARVSVSLRSSEEMGDREVVAFAPRQVESRPRKK